MRYLTVYRSNIPCLICTVIVYVVAIATHCAASKGHMGCLATLLQQPGVDIDAADSNGCTAVAYAASHGHCAAICRLILSHADTNHRDNRGRTSVTVSYLFSFNDILSLPIYHYSAPPLTSSATSWSISFWLTILPWSSYFVSVTITTLFIHHPIILSFQSQNFSFSQILSSIDIWHPLGLTPLLFGPAHGFYVYFLFSFFQFFSEF